MNWCRVPQRPQARKRLILSMYRCIVNYELKCLSKVMLCDKLVAVQLFPSLLGTNVALTCISPSAALPIVDGGTTMKKTIVLFSLTLLALGGFAGTANPTERTTAPSAQTAPDNTGRNVRDRSGATLTPGDQSESEADRTLTQQIRRPSWLTIRCRRWPRTSRLSRSMASSRCEARSTVPTRKRLLRPKPNKSRG